MNHGSFTSPASGNDVIRFWMSNDLREWRYAGAQYDSRSDPRWYRVPVTRGEPGRWDHMYVIRKEDASGYWGYCVGMANGDSGGCGFLESPDGLSWTALPPPEFDFGDLPVGFFEHSGCAVIKGKYYLIGGTLGYMGSYGYSVFTLVGDSPRGPFRPDRDAYRLCGSSGQEGVWGNQMLAAMADCDGELLVSQYIYPDAALASVDYTQSRQNVWLTPIKKAVVDDHGHLRLGYWTNNDRARGEELAIETTTTVSAVGDSRPPTDVWAHALLTQEFDFDRGVIIEGALHIDAGAEFGFFKYYNRPAYCGFVIESTAAEGRAVLLNAGHPAWRESLICDLRWDRERIESRVVDATGRGCAAVTGIDAGRTQMFRLWIRKGVFELYVDDLLFQTFPLPASTTGRVGFIVRNGRGTFERVRAWAMNLSG